MIESILLNRVNMIYKFSKHISSTFMGYGFFLVLLFIIVKLIKLCFTKLDFSKF